MRSFARKFIVTLIFLVITMSILVPNSASIDNSQRSQMKGLYEKSGNNHSNSTSREISTNGNDTTTDSNETQTSETSEPSESNTSDSETSTEHTDPPEPPEPPETTEPETSTEHTETSSQDAKFKLEVNAQKESAQIQSEVERAGIKEKFEAKVEFSSQPVIEVQYQSGSGFQDLESEMKLKISSLVEFTDIDSDGKIGTSDSILQEISLKDLGFKDLVFSQVDIGNGTIDNVIVAESTDGVFLIRFHIVGQFATLGAISLKPTAIKFDLELQSFPFISNTSLIAIRFSAESSFEIKQEDSNRVGMDQNNPTYFSWMNTAKIDQQDRNVTTNIDFQSGNSVNIDLIYPQGSQIIHDPELGVHADLVYASTIASSLATQSTTSNPIVSIPYGNNVIPVTENLVPKASVQSSLPALFISSLIFVLIPILRWRKD